MQKLLNTVAPLGVMTACVIWCCWSQLRESTPLLAATEANLPRIERKLLHPELSPVSERDPFLQYKPEPPHEPEPTPSSEDIEAQTKIAEKSPFDPQPVLASIRLDATILGVRRLAVINGKIHNEGEIVVLKAAPEVPCRLQRVFADGIVMQIEKQTHFINYSQTAKEVTDPAPDGFGDELPEGTPTPDQIDHAVAGSLAQQEESAGDQDNLNSEETDDLRTHAALEDCEFEKGLTDHQKNLKELLNNNE